MAAASIIGGLGSAVIGGVTSLIRMNRQEKANERAIKASLTGYRYLKDNEVVNQAQDQGAVAQNRIGALLGLGSATDEEQMAAERAFAQYRDSTGYEFRRQQGLEGITGTRATQGLLNSGGTLRAMEEFGQGIAAQEFGNYLSQLQGERGTGLSAAYNVASQGGSGGANAANVGMQGAARVNAIGRQGTEDIMSGLGAAVGGFSSMGQDRGWWQ